MALLWRKKESNGGHQKTGMRFNNFLQVCNSLAIFYFKRVLIQFYATMFSSFGFFFFLLFLGANQFPQGVVWKEHKCKHDVELGTGFQTVEGHRRKWKQKQALEMFI